MKSFATIVALLSLASLGASSATPSSGSVSSCKASDQVLVETRNVTAAGHEIQISTKACSADVLASHSLAKRQVFDACGSGGTTTFTCVTNQGAGPLEADCVALENALPAFAATQSNPFSFTVLPQFVQEFTLGTCLWAWINTNPIGGAIFAVLLRRSGGQRYNPRWNCIFPGDTAGIAIPSNPQLNPVVLAWAFKAFHRTYRIRYGEWDPRTVQIQLRKSCLAISKAILRFRAVHGTQKFSARCRFHADRRDSTHRKRCPEEVPTEQERDNTRTIRLDLREGGDAYLKFLLKDTFFSDLLSPSIFTCHLQIVLLSWWSVSSEDRSNVPTLAPCRETNIKWLLKSKESIGGQPSPRDAAPPSGPLHVPLLRFGDFSEKYN
ncbi:hypothetical protein B0H14DRAFT_3562397 [Mycena olivaceomarginata]|nr:hypothetical protein B0H14DRAFT_3562397 [Mycena olivaceomarginata]